MPLPVSHQKRCPSGLPMASLARRILPNRQENPSHPQRLRLEGEFLGCHLRRREAEFSDDLDHDHRLVVLPVALLPRSPEPHRLRNLPCCRTRLL